MRSQSHPLLLEGLITCLILGGTLVVGVASRWGEWSRQQWLRWLARLPIAAGVLSVAGALSYTAHSLLPDGPLGLLCRLVPLVIGSIYAVGQLVEFAFAPAYDDLSEPAERSPWYVPEWIWHLMSFALLMGAIIAYGRYTPWFPAERLLLGLLGGWALVVGVAPPAWARGAPPLARIGSTVLGFLLLLASVLVPGELLIGLWSRAG